MASVKNADLLKGARITSVAEMAAVNVKKAITRMKASAYHAVRLSPVACNVDPLMNAQNVQVISFTSMKVFANVERKDRINILIR